LLSEDWDEQDDAYTDTFHGGLKLGSNEQVVEVVEFETEDPALRGEMTITITLAGANSGTDVVAVHDGLPPGLSAAENPTGWQSSLAKLAALVVPSQPCFTRHLRRRVSSFLSTHC